MDKPKPKAKPSDAKRQCHSREFKIEAVRQLEEGKISGTQLALMLRNLRCQTAFFIPKPSRGLNKCCLTP